MKKDIFIITIESDGWFIALLDRASLLQGRARLCHSVQRRKSFFRDCCVCYIDTHTHVQVLNACRNLVFSSSHSPHNPLLGRRTGDFFSSSSSSSSFSFSSFCLTGWDKSLRWYSGPSLSFLVCRWHAFPHSRLFFFSLLKLVLQEASMKRSSRHQVIDSQKRQYN